MEGLRKLTELIVIVVTLLCYGCPIQVIVQACGLAERTVACLGDRAGTQSKKLHQTLMAVLLNQADYYLFFIEIDYLRDFLSEKKREILPTRAPKANNHAPIWTSTGITGNGKRAKKI